jgi:hypothetical protein
MTGDQSRLLKVGDRVCWERSTTDLGTVKSNSWGGLVVAWDDGRTNSIHHNDMKQVERMPVKTQWLIALAISRGAALRAFKTFLISQS